MDSLLLRQNGSSWFRMTRVTIGHQDERRLDS